MESSTRTRNDLRRILLLSLLALALVLAAVLGLAAFAASAVDRTVAAEQQALLGRTIDRRRLRLVEDVTSATIWDDAYKAVAPEFDTVWADANFGVYYADFMHHSRTIGLDRRDRLIYASEGGEMTAPAASARFAADVAPLLARLRLEERRRAARAGPRRLGFEAVVTDSAVVTSAGSVWLVAMSTVVPETAGPTPVSGPGVVFASARLVDADFLATLEKDLGLKGVVLRPAGAGPLAVPLRDMAGRPVGALTWTPARPGMGVLKDAAPLSLLLLVAFAATVAALGLRVNRALRALAVNEAELERTLRDLTVARDHAQAASVAKSLFLANVSHEIRTPLNGVLGMAQVMEHGELSPDQRQHLGVIRASGVALLTVLNDVLDLAKIEAGKLEIREADTDLARVVSTACAPFEALASEKTLRLDVTVAADAGGLWRLDGDRLAQVLANLVSNAIKFTQQGEIAVEVTAVGDALAFSVRDTGVGIPAEHVSALFQKFSQVDSSTTRQHGGTGLGLAICRELVELMGGTIGVESQPGLGSRFHFTLTARRVGPGAAA